MFRGLSRSSRRQAFPHMNAGLLLPRAGLLFDIPNRYPFVDRVGKHDGQPQLLQYIQGPVDLLSSSIAGTEAVESKHGTATVTVSAGKLAVGSGTLWSFTLSNGSQYEFGSGGWVWDVSENDRHLSVSIESCKEGREFGSDHFNARGWAVAAAGNNLVSAGYAVRVTNGTNIPSLLGAFSACSYQNSESTVSTLTDGINPILANSEEIQITMVVQ